MSPNGDVQRRPSHELAKMTVELTAKASRGVSGKDHSEQSARDQRPASRPTLPTRQSSYSKRHASFDTPREVPFHSQRLPPGLVARASYSRKSSDSTVTPTSHPPSPAAGPSTSRDPAQRAPNMDNDSYAGGSLRCNVRNNTGGRNRAMSPPPCQERNISSVDVAYEIERAFSPPLFKSPREEGVEDYFSGPSWDTELLRPRPLPSPRKKSPRDRHFQDSQNFKDAEQQQKRFATLHPTVQAIPHRIHDSIYSPTPSRPSSTLSLPLPSLMPFFALPPVTFAPTSPLPQINKERGRSNDPTTMSFDGHDHTVNGENFEEHMTSNSRSPSSFDMMNCRRSSSESPEGLSSKPSRLSQPESLSSDSSSSRVSTVSTASSSLPPPTPPTIHSPVPTSLFDEEDKPTESELKKRVPYHFLNHAPPPADAHLAAEMEEKEYRIIAKLPGFDRDCIMVSTRKKRTLHIAADSWKPGGGHFEKRVTFDYDADLTRVRAEFDGEHLRIIVPRKDYRQSWLGPHSD